MVNLSHGRCCLACVTITVVCRSVQAWGSRCTCQAHGRPHKHQSSGASGRKACGCWVFFPLEVSQQNCLTFGAPIGSQFDQNLSAEWGSLTKIYILHISRSVPGNSVQELKWSAVQDCDLFHRARALKVQFPFIGATAADEPWTPK